jgi:hypothetical protein
VALVEVCREVEKALKESARSKADQPSREST